MGTLRELTWLTQLGFSIVSPLALCVLGAVWLRDRFGLGTWVILLGLFLGLGGAISAGISFARAAAPRQKKDAPPPAFNEHK